MSGLLAGALILSFRWSSEWLISHAVGTGDPEAFEQLSGLARFCLPLLGAIALGLVFRAIPAEHLQVGVGHVMERLAYFKADLPWRNALAQYLGGLTCLTVGHSVGREGPCIHLGAAISSWLGRALRAPNNSMRTLLACGTAASIAASFNTPIAGVIFAMEVVLMEYTIAGFTPVILAAVVAAWMARALYGPAAAFDVPAIELSSLWELPFLIFVGIAIGALAAAFNATVSILNQAGNNHSVLARFSLAGCITGTVAVAVPEVMGVGYDTVEGALNGAIPVVLLIIIVAAKFAASATCVGFGLPAGLIGPTLVMGACAGAALGFIGHAASPNLSSSPSLYAVLGMGAMMGAVLQAPLAALMAILELTANSNIILPGMVCIISATLTAHVVFHRDSVFLANLKARGIDYFSDPVALALSRAGVSSRMREDFAIVPRHLSAGEAAKLSRGQGRWLVITEDQSYRALVHAEALLMFTESLNADEQIDLLSSSLPRRSTTKVSTRATLQEARIARAQNGAQTLCIMHMTNGGKEELCGVITETELER